MEKKKLKPLIYPFQIGQQVKILPIVIKYRTHPKGYREGEAVITDVSIRGRNEYEYGIESLTDSGESGWWFPHECMELMLDGKITDMNMRLAIDTIVAGRKEDGFDEE